MKRITLPLFALFLCICTFAQDSELNITPQSQWNPDSIPQYSDLWGYADCENNEYAILGSRHFIHFIDVTDPATPVEIAFFAGGEASVWRDIKTYRGHAYAVSDNTEEGLMIFDLGGLPNDIVKTYHSNADFNSAQNIFIDEVYGRLYVVGSDVADLLIFDLLTDPDVPVLLTATQLPGGYVRDIHVRENVAYCSHLENGLYIYDCTNPESIGIMGSLAIYPGEVMNSSSWLSPDGNQLLFCDEVPGAQVKLLDVSDPSNLAVEEEHLFGSALLGADLNSIAHQPYFRDNFAFVSYYHDGLQVFDISDPENIQKVAFLDTYPDNETYDGLLGNWGLYPYLPSGNILASDIDNGLFVMTMDSIELEPLDNNNTISSELELTAAPILCEGDSVTLSAIEGDYTYLWTHDGQLLDVEEPVLTVKEAGVYQLEISNGICQAMSDNYEIEFLERPDLSAMQGDIVDICYGDAYQIMAPSGFSYYIWLKDGNVLPNTNNLLFVVQSGSYSLIAYNESGCASTSAIYDVNVVDVPTPNLQTSETTICNNQEALLEAAEGAEQYNWYFNGMLMEETEENFLPVNQSGNYQVELQIGDCSELSQTVEITVLQAPNNSIGINGASQFCLGETAILNAAQEPEIISWNWFLNNELISTEPNVEVSQSGEYELIVTSTNNCTSSNTIEITVVQATTPTIAVADNELTSSMAMSYQWYLNASLIPGATQQNYTAQQAGFYQVEITDNDGCTALSGLVEVQLTATNDPEDFNTLQIHPNPTTASINITLENETGDAMDIRLLDAKGQLLQQKRTTLKGIINEQLELNDYPSGLYFVQLRTEAGMISRKIIKE